MKKMVFAALATTLCVALPINVDWAPEILLAPASASAAKRSGTVTVDLALIGGDGTDVVTVWIRSSGNVDEFTSHVSADNQIDIAGILTQWDWEFVSRKPSASGTAADLASSIVTDFEDRKGPPPDDYAITLGSGGESGSVPLTIGQLLVAQDSPGVYSSVAYIDFASAYIDFASGLASGGAASAESSAPLPGPAAASSGGTTSSRYVVWPEAADLGETVAILLETQSEVDLYSDGALLNPTSEKFSIVLTDLANPGPEEIITPRAVLEAPAALGSLLVGLQSESWVGIVLVFDLPDPLVTIPSPTFPAELEVRVDYENYAVFDGKKLDVIATGGTPLADSDVESLRELGLRPMLRLRPSWDPDAEPSPVGFNPNWEIGALEFTLRYQKPATGDIANLSALANGDALAAVASAAKLAGQKAWRISLIDPEGFSIPAKGCVSGDCYSGRWSLLDLPLDKIPEGLPVNYPIFTPGDFTIEDLRVIEVDGAQSHEPDVGEIFFRIHAVDNLVDPTGGPSPTAVTIWPTRAYAGDTVAVLFNSEADVDTNPDAALLDASVENVVVRITDPDEYTESVTPRAVIEAPAALGSGKVGFPPASQTGVIAFFEIPDPWRNASLNFNPPKTFDIAIDYEGVQTLGTHQVLVIGTGGVPTDFTPVAPLSDLTLGPMLRLRPSWDPDAEPSPVGFNPNWEIGALEFDLHYQRSGIGEVSNVVAVGNGEAVASLAMVNLLLDDGTDKLWRISLVEPAGLTILHKGCPSQGDCYSGRWALVDLLLETKANGLQPGEPIFFASEFSIEAVKVYDRDGEQLNQTTAGDAFFHKDVVSVPEPSATVQLVTGLLGVWALGWWRRRGVARLG